MTEAIYKVGDILELDGNVSFPWQFGMFSKDEKIRCIVLKCIQPGYEFVIYTLLVHKNDNSFDTTGVNQKDILAAAKRIGHIDISSFLRDEESLEPDYQMMFTAVHAMQCADLRKENEDLKNKIRKLNENVSAILKTDDILEGVKALVEENEKLKADNKKLADGGTRNLQKIACAEKYLADAASRLYQAREHLNTQY